MSTTETTETDSPLTDSKWWVVAFITFVAVAVLAGVVIAATNKRGPDVPPTDAVIAEVAIESCRYDWSLDAGQRWDESAARACAFGFMGAVGVLIDGEEDVDDDATMDLYAWAATDAVDGAWTVDEDWKFAHASGWVSGISWYEGGARTDVKPCGANQTWVVARQACAWE